MAEPGSLTPRKHRPVIVFECPHCGYAVERHKRKIYQPMYCEDCPRRDSLPKVRVRFHNGNVLERDGALEHAR